MKRILTLGLAAGLTVGAIAAYPAQASNHTGNGAPNGAHYNLNVIGVPKSKTADMTGNSGHRIFVPESGKTQINLTEGPFQVLDANGTDGPAAFQLPNPDEDGDGETSYSVYVRALGKPNRSADMQSCYTDGTGTWCAVSWDGGVEQITIERTSGRQRFENVSRDLLYVDFCVEWSDTADDDGVITADECTDVDQLPLFSEDASYFWEYDNHGLKLAQFRFYEVPTVTPWTPANNAD